MSDSDRSVTPKKKRAKRNELSKDESSRVYKKKVFQPEWLLKNEFKLWLREVPSDNTKCKCIACNTILVSGKSEIEKHSVGIKHKLNVKSIQGTKPAFSLSNVKEVETFQNNVKVAEIKLASFFGEHNIAFQTVDHLTPVLQDIFPDSKICKAISLHRTKLTSIIKNVVAPVEINNTIDILKTNPFSVLVDESTDLTCSKFLCLLVRFVHSESGVIHTKLLNLYL